MGYDMEKLEECLRLLHQQRFQRWLPYGLLALSALVCIWNLSCWNLLNGSLLFAAVLVVAFAAALKTEVAYVLAALLMALHALSVSVGAAFSVLAIGVIAAFGCSYGRNTLGYFCVYWLLLNARDPFVMGTALGLYALYCVHRGFGMPLMSALLATLMAALYGLFQQVPFFVQPSFVLPIDHIPDYVSGILNDPSLLAWLVPQQGGHSLFIDTIRANLSFFVVAAILLYGLFFCLRRTKVEEKEYRLSKQVTGAVITLGVLGMLAVLLPLVSHSPIEPLDVLQMLVGTLLGLAFALILPRPACNEILTFAQKQKLQQQERLSQVVERVEKKTIKEGWDSIAGYADVKEELRQVLEPYTDSRLMRKMRESHIDPVKGLLLFGPPGCGKTLFARALASESKMNIISVAGAQFTSKWVGESDRNLRLIFEQARMQAPCILFFDELESFLPPRDQAQHSWEKTLVTTFLAQMDGFQELKNVLVVGATNYPDQIDAAAIRPGRFDKCIYIGAPDIEARRAILQKYVGERSSLTGEQLETIARHLERFTAADIEGLIKELYRQKHYEALSEDEILQAAASYQPTVTLDMRDRYEQLKRQYNRRLVAPQPQKQEKRYTWESIAGMEKEKEALRNYVEKPLLYGEMYQKLALACPKGTLLFGPPGCGKTLFAKVAAAECDATFLTVNGPQLLSGRVGESEEKLRRVFREAREHTPAIIFFDEFDSIAQHRSLSVTSTKIINQLLTEMDGMEELEGVIVLAATNRIDTIDPALRRPGRFDHILYIGLPDLASREKQFAHHLGNLSDTLDLHRLAQRSEGFTCADVEGACRRMKEHLLDAMIAQRDATLTQEGCEALLEGLRPSLSEEEIAAYEAMRTYANE